MKKLFLCTLLAFAPGNDIVLSSVYHNITSMNERVLMPFSEFKPHYMIEHIQIINDKTCIVFIDDNSKRKVTIVDMMKIVFTDREYDAIGALKSNFSKMIPMLAATYDGMRYNRTKDLMIDDMQSYIMLNELKECERVLQQRRANDEQLDDVLAEILPEECMKSILSKFQICYNTFLHVNQYMKAEMKYSAPVRVDRDMQNILEQARAEMCTLQISRIEQSKIDRGVSDRTARAGCDTIADKILEHYNTLHDQPTAHSANAKPNMIQLAHSAYFNANHQYVSSGNMRGMSIADRVLQEHAIAVQNNTNSNQTEYTRSATVNRENVEKTNSTNSNQAEVILDISRSDAVNREYSGQTNSASKTSNDDMRDHESASVTTYTRGSAHVFNSLGPVKNAESTSRNSAHAQFMPASAYPANPIHAFKHVDAPAAVSASSTHNTTKYTYPINR